MTGEEKSLHLSNEEEDVSNTQMNPEWELDEHFDSMILQVDILWYAGRICNF